MNSSQVRQALEAVIPEISPISPRTMPSSSRRCGSTAARNASTPGRSVAAAGRYTGRNRKASTALKPIVAAMKIPTTKNRAHLVP